jgi:hypothetical protein
MAINRPNNRFFHRAIRLQASTPAAMEHLSSGSADSCTESTAEHFSLEPSREDPAVWSKPSRRSTRQDGQINYLSTLTIFMKQTTYLATLPT